MSRPSATLQSHPSCRARRPRFLPDPGWLFVAAGLAVCAAGVLAPARADLDRVRHRVRLLEGELRVVEARVAAREAFLERLEQRDPALMRRLAAAQLNLTPGDEIPLLVDERRTASVGDWIDASLTVSHRPVAATPVEPTTLLEIATGPHRILFLAGGVLALFVGLLIGLQPEPRTPTVRLHPADETFMLGRPGRRRRAIRRIALPIRSGDAGDG